MRFTMIRFVLTVILTIIISNRATLCTAFYATGTSDNVSIAGGHNIPIKDAPFMVSIESTDREMNKTFCGGSIIHERFILTAAHCVSDVIDYSLIKVRSGSADKARKIRTKPVKNVICHEHFPRRTKVTFCFKHFPFFFGRNGNDICLLELTKTVKFGPKVAKVGLPAKDLNLKPGTEVKVTGWGLTKEGGTLSRYLRQVKIPIISKKICSKIYKKLNNKEICAGSRGKDACQGDSGGPLTDGNDVQIGIVSYGNELCGCTDGIGVYTRISSHLDWINNTIKKTLKKLENTHNTTPISRQG